MAQFDVHANQGRLRDSIPFVVVVQSSLFDDYRRRIVVPLVIVVQSSLFDDYRRRIVVPLVRRSIAGGTPTALRARLNPSFRVRNVEVVLHPLDMVSVALDQLGPRVGSLAGHGQAITDALDEVLTRSWG